MKTAAFQSEKADTSFEASHHLLYRAAKSAVYGKLYSFDSGIIADALFVYLSGLPCPKSIRAINVEYCQRPLVCLSAQWEDYIKKNYPNAQIYKRYLMKPTRNFNLKNDIHLPYGFTAALFDEKAFELHPFSHGVNYPCFTQFHRNGSGAVIWHKGKIVSSASSFLSLNNQVELDVSTIEAYRGKGLASACISLMLKDCAEKGLTVNWDAQNETSVHLAEKFGFEILGEYFVYFLPKKQD